MVYIKHILLSPHHASNQNFFEDKQEPKVLAIAYSLISWSRSSNNNFAFMLISDLFGGAMTMINKISRGSVGALFILSLIGRWLSSWTLHLYNWKKSHAGQ
jgi:hypothetical protein